MKVKRSISHSSAKSVLHVLLLALALCFTGVSVRAQLLEVHADDKVTVRGQDSTLPDVLRLFARQGVDVNIDPAIDVRISEDFEDLTVREVLRELLRDFGYVTSWDMVKGPLGNIPKLSGIDVYRRGYASSVRPLIVRAGKVDVVYDPNGSMYARDELLIGVKPGTTLEEFKNIVSAVGGVVMNSVSSRGVYQIKLPQNSLVPAVVARLANHPKVAAVEPNYVIEVPEAQQQPAQPTEGSDVASVGDAGGVTSTDPGAKPSETLTPLTAKPGASTVAVLDTGLSAQFDMGNLVKGVHDATNPDATEVGDATGHGTQMAMIASGLVQPTGSNAPAEDSGTPVLAIKAFDEDGMTTNFGLMESIQYAIENDAKILSLSWGSEQSSEFLQDAIVSAQERDLIVVAAVGNEASGVTSYPAAYDGVVGVGALSSDGQLWENSNYGSFVDLVAPGHASFPIGHEGPPGTYVGTSISTAYVAGYISQLIEQNPQASQQQILDKLYGSVQDQGDAGVDVRYGRGVLLP